MSSVNKCILLGNVGIEPKIEYNQENKARCRFTLATSKKINNEDKVTWHNIIFFGKQAEIIDKYVKKGDKLYLEGQISYNEYQGKYYTNIIGNSVYFLNSNQKTNTNHQQNSNYQNSGKYERQNNNLTDDLPF